MVLCDGDEMAVWEELDEFVTGLVLVEEGELKLLGVFFHVLYVDQALVQWGVDSP